MGHVSQVGSHGQGAQLFMNMTLQRGSSKHYRLPYTWTLGCCDMWMYVDHGGRDKRTTFFYVFAGILSDPGWTPARLLSSGSALCVPFPGPDPRVHVCVLCHRMWTCAHPPTSYSPP